MDQRSSRDRDQGTFERMGEQLGEAAGRAMGRGSDRAADMIGSFLGSAVDSLGEWWSSQDANRAAGSFGEQEDRACRRHFEADVETGTQRNYDEVRPLYQFGHMARENPDYRGRQFDEIEPDLQKAWDDESRRSHGDWPEVRGYVGFGYERDDRGGVGDV